MERSHARRWTAAALAVASVAFLPFARGVLAGDALVGRELSRVSFPQRALAVEGLRAGEIRYWNPDSHQGAPLALPAVSYPPDLLQVLWSDEAGFSRLLVAHVPLAALAMLALAASLGLSPLAAAAGGLVYGLGGFALACLDRYAPLQALAWAPLLVVCARRAAGGAPRAAALAAVVAAIGLSTTGVAITGQAALVGLLLGADRSRPLRSVAALASLGLGAALAAPTLIALQAARAAVPGPTASARPIALLGVLVAPLPGPGATLYLGAAVLALVVVGLAHGGLPRARLVVAALLACGVAIVGLDPIAPAQAFFTVHLCAALFAAAGVEALSGSDARACWRTLVLACLGLCGALALAPLLAPVAGGAPRSLLEGVSPASVPSARGEGTAAAVATAAATGGLLCALVAAVAAAVRMRRLAPRAGGAAAALVAILDLMRAGAGASPMASPERLAPTPEGAPWIERIRAAGGRVFTCAPEDGGSWARGLETAGDREAWRAAGGAALLLPEHNLRAHVPAAFGPERAPGGSEASCAQLASLVPRLRRAGVTHVLRDEPASHPDLVLEQILRPPAVAPLEIFVYRLEAPMPLRSVARRALPAASPEEAASRAREPGFAESGAVAVEGLAAPLEDARGRIVSLYEETDRVDVVLVSDRPSLLVLRDTWAPGWSATVDDAPAPVLRADGGYRAVPIPEGPSRVVLDYALPGLAAGRRLAGVAALAVLALGLAPRRREASGAA